MLTELDLEPAHLVGWSMGAGVVMQYALDHPVRTMTLISPISPYGFGGTAADGSLLNADAAGTGGGGVNPDFIERCAPATGAVRVRPLRDRCTPRRT